MELFEVVFVNKDKLDTVVQSHGQQKCPNVVFPFAQSALTPVAIKEARTLVAEDIESHTKQVLELTLRTASFDYQPGDTVGILPRNAIADVNKLLYALKLEEKADSYCQLKLRQNAPKKSARLPTHIPAITTPREILSDCLDLRAAPKKKFLRVLAENCTLIQERDFLNGLTSTDGSSTYNEIILEKGVTLLDILDLCGSCQPTLATLAEHLPRLLPRPYSIANSPLAPTSSNEFKIIFSILPTSPGVTTGMMRKLALQRHINAPAAQLLLYLRKSNKFRFTEEEAAASQILIGIGTGLAPFLGFLEHKKYLRNTQQELQGETWLFAGATTSAGIVHRDQLVELQKQGILNRYFESVSRLPQSHFHYVQEQIEANASEFIEFLLRPQTILYICADGAQISKSIAATIATCLEQELTINSAEAMEILRDLRAKGKYREDLWV